MVRTPRRLLLAALVVPALALADAHGEKAAGPTAEQALQKLKEGHARFLAGTMRHPDEGAKRLKALAAGQRPFATILGCADSRVPPELLFDEGFGDLFVVRVAGNVSEPATLGSIEYAGEHLGVPLVVVLGHHKCGAVKATAEAAGPVEGNIGKVVDELRPAVAEAKAHPGKRGLVDDAVHANVAIVARQLVDESPVMRKLVEEGKVKIVTAVYDLDTHTVEWAK
jgi:carbonic anhydrase